MMKMKSYQLFLVVFFSVSLFSDPVIDRIREIRTLLPLFQQLAEDCSVIDCSSILTVLSVSDLTKDLDFAELRQECRTLKTELEHILSNHYQVDFSKARERRLLKAIIPLALCQRAQEIKSKLDDLALVVDARSVYNFGFEES